MRATILSHRDIVRISVGRIPLGPNALRVTQGVLAILRAGGVPDRLAVQGYLLLIAVVNGFTIDEPAAGDRAEFETRLAEGARATRDYLAALPPERFPDVVALADHFAISDPEQRFALLLDLFVGGLAARARATG
jgi:TetR/AcrR family tetracycline transcriptional repressor